MTLLDQGISNTRTGPVLSDGTPLRDLIDYEKREVSMRLLSDPEVFKLEMKHLFGKTWNLLGHESEIPEPGDYIMRQMGLDPVIVTRDRKGGINVLLNVCTHRGMQICRSEGGKGATFKCPYHGWSFSNDGRFLGAPIAKEEMHGDILPKSELGLRKARVETYAGMIFANWDDNAESLDEFLGDIKFYTDLMFDRSEGGLEVLGPPQRFVIRANWKCAGEQHSGDGFHNLTLHYSLQELEMMAGGEDKPVAMAGVNVSANGHGLRCIDQTEPFVLLMKDKGLEDMSVVEKLTMQPPPGMTAEHIPYLQQRFSEGALRLLADSPPCVGGLFPNVGCFALNMPMPDGMSSLISFHAFVPLSPGEFEFYNWFLVEKGATPELRERMSNTSNLSFGASGFVETDDADTWPQMTRMAEGFMGAQQKIRYHAVSGERVPQDWPGGGHVYEGFGKDDNQWNWWMTYFDKMLGSAS
ncbi:aromatic ring-hydroxylating oxygenase subunit alpha [Mycolicibacterium porcinum]|uniref:Rieske 2Fe-2S domain-containing protein n=1 Tax=Mycolicibacterium porcinum TaxID=39693 RepID=A0AAW5T092_9MYCO|nr:Rieske 2Fe-2S domain-containing protein [Mycolicibacterium porcinum]MCV7388103.1 Rieske 2Fe-2S domain-containing protein [Mycolicibacterium porcinum]ORB43376.1 aromatic ring-hydroxylating dioxygenase subunit alpha [Mycolicibacterium porcinum]CDO31212.1 Rieske (2Fe-2S) domain-containing protein [Mycolicibacterium vulneris]